MNPAGIHQLYSAWNSPESATLQAEAGAVRKVFQGGYMIPALKHAVATFSGHSPWRNVRPPLVALDEAMGRKFDADLQAIGFEMLGYPHA